MPRGCFDAGTSHVINSTYRDHEIVVSRCNNCPDFIVDVRSDNFDGDFMTGYIDKDIVSAIIKAKASIDQHEKNKKIMVNIPF